MKIKHTTTPIQCECGDATGVRCQWTGPKDQTVVIEWMPEWIRDSHEAAGNCGSWPHNGSERLRVFADCARYIDGKTIEASR